MFNRIKRWRTSRGFGVHSPFAFNLITGVLREYDAHYYAYAEIDSLCPSARRSRHVDNFTGLNYAIPDARLLFRLLCRFNPGQIIEVGNGHEVTNLIIERSIPRALRLRWVTNRKIDYLHDASTFILINQLRPEILPSVRRMILERIGCPRGAVVFMLNVYPGHPAYDLWQELRAALPAGMDFYNRHVGLITALPGLPRQSYVLDF